jgi:hypothetical protein
LIEEKVAKMFDHDLLLSQTKTLKSQLSRMCWKNIIKTREPRREREQRRRREKEKKGRKYRSHSSSSSCTFLAVNVAMAEYVEAALESMLPELEQMKRVKLFKGEEIKWAERTEDGLRSGVVALSKLYNQLIAKRINSSREVALGNAVVAHAHGGGPKWTAGKTITKASCLAGRNSRAGPALENEAF